MHVSLVPYISAAHELKTKPTQHSVMMLRQLGISPDALVLRSDRPLNQSIKDKISLMCDVDAEGVVNCVDAPSIYDVPKILFEEGLDAYVVRELGLPFHDVDWDEWADLLERVHHPKHEVNIAIVGKYIDLPDAYLSVTEAIKAGGFANWAKVNVKWVAADRCETTEGAAAALDNVDGIVIPGGFGIRGIDGKIGALKFARETKLPALGLCLGLQSMVIEYSRHVLGIEDANSSEFEPDCANPVIATMEEQKDIVAGKGDMGHTMRLGSYPAELEEGSLVAELYGTTHVTERHRHRYEVNVGLQGYVVPRRRPARSPARARTASTPSSWNCRGTVHPFYVATPGSRRSASLARPSRTRCSPAWSRPRSTIRRRAGALSCRTHNIVA